MSASFTSHRLLPSRNTCFFKICVLILAGLLLVSPAKGQINYQTLYGQLFEPFKNAIDHWEMSPADYSGAMHEFGKYAAIRAPLFRIDPNVGNTYYRVHSFNLRDDSRRFVRFMFNCYRNNPKICHENRCLDQAWSMIEDIKSLNSRVTMLKFIFQQLPENDRRQLVPLFEQLGKTQDAIPAAQLEEKIAAKIPAYRYLSQMEVTRDMIRAALMPDEVFLSFFVMDNRRALYVWKIDQIKDELIPLKINSAEVFLRIEHTKASLERDIEYQRFINHLLDYERSVKDEWKSFTPFLRDPLTLDTNLAVFARYLIHPVKIAKGKKLIISADQNLSALPFELLPLHNGRRLFEDHDVVYTPSAKIFFYQRKMRTARKPVIYRHYIGFGYSDEGALTSANVEVEIAADIFKPNATLLLDASETSIYQHLGQSNKYDLVHFSTHGIIHTTAENKDWETPLDDKYTLIFKGPDVKTTYLLFGKDNLNNGNLEGQEVSRITRVPPLVVLSGCESAPSADVKQYLGWDDGVRLKGLNAEQRLAESFHGGCVCSYGETFSDLAGAFFARGAQSVIGTQWSVRSDVSSRFMQTFFEKLIKSNDPQRALREAKAVYLYDNTLDWASFILIGD